MDSFKGFQQLRSLDLGRFEFEMKDDWSMLEEQNGSEDGENARFVRKLMKNQFETIAFGSFSDMITPLINAIPTLEKIVVDFSESLVHYEREEWDPLRAKCTVHIRKMPIAEGGKIEMIKYFNYKYRWL